MRQTFIAANALKSIYGQEKQFTVSSFLEHLMSLECKWLSLFRQDNDLNSNGDLSIRYKINDDGDELSKNIFQNMKGVSRRDITVGKP